MPNSFLLKVKNLTKANIALPSASSNMTRQEHGAKSGSCSVGTGRCAQLVYLVGHWGTDTLMAALHHFSKKKKLMYLWKCTFEKKQAWYSKNHFLDVISHSCWCQCQGRGFSDFESRWPCPVGTTHCLGSDLYSGICFAPAEEFAKPSSSTPVPRHQLHRHRISVTGDGAGSWGGCAAHCQAAD